jgi:hypothetical protein
VSEVVGETDWEPEGKATVPMPWLIEADTAFVVVQESCEGWPWEIVDGLAVSVQVGAGIAVTVRAKAAEFVRLPLVPRMVTVELPGGVVGATENRTATLPPAVTTNGAGGCVEMPLGKPSIDTFTCPEKPFAPFTETVIKGEAAPCSTDIEETERLIWKICDGGGSADEAPLPPPQPARAKARIATVGHAPVLNFLSPRPLCCPQALW